MNTQMDMFATQQETLLRKHLPHTLKELAPLDESDIELLYGFFADTLAILEHYEKNTEFKGHNSLRERILKTISLRTKTKISQLPISHEDIRLPKTCQLSGMPINYADSWRSGASPKVLMVNPNKPYTADNIVIVRKDQTSLYQTHLSEVLEEEPKKFWKEEKGEVVASIEKVEPAQPTVSNEISIIKAVSVLREKIPGAYELMEDTGQLTSEIIFELYSALRD
jgi:hypothetical protein